VKLDQAGDRRANAPRVVARRATTCYTVAVNELADVERLVRASGLFAGQAIAIRPLHGGITNRNFVVSVDTGDYVVRIPGERTSLLGIDRAFEADAATRAAQLGIGPAVLGMLDGVGTLARAQAESRLLESPWLGRDELETARALRARVEAVASR